MKSGIEHQMQPTANTCCATCIAMILGVPAADVIAEFDARYRNESSYTPEAYFREKGVDVIPGLSSARCLYPGRTYMLTVPSLNHEATMHSIVAVDDDEGILIFDPQQGTGNKFYTFNPNGYLGPNEVRLKNYVIDMEIMLYG